MLDGGAGFELGDFFCICAGELAGCHKILHLWIHGEVRLDAGRDVARDGFKSG
jgi:hypothetical protein